MRRMVASVGAVGALVLLPLPGEAQPATNSPVQPHFRGQGPGQAQSILRKLSGTVSAVDTNRLSFTLQVAGKPHLCKLTAKTKVTRNGLAPASLSDLTAGKKVEVTLQKVEGKPDQVLAVDIKPE